MIKPNIINKISRYILSYLPYLRIIKRPNFRPEGISAIVRIWNEELYLEQAIISIKDFVDEIIAVDTGSTDNSWEILNKLKNKITKLKIYRFLNQNFWDFSNFAIRQTNFKWILKWDADCIAIEENNKKWMTSFINWLYNLDKNMYYYINIPLIDLSGDFYHQYIGKFRKDIEIFTYSDKINYIKIERRLHDYQSLVPTQLISKEKIINLEGLLIPRFYRILLYEQPVGFHLNIKSAERHLYSYFHLQWLAEKNKEKVSINLEEFVQEKVKEYWGIDNIKKAAKFYINEYVKQFVPYDHKLGEYPEIIKLLANKSNYKIIYKDNKIIGRNDGFED